VRGAKRFFSGRQQSKGRIFAESFASLKGLVEKHQQDFERIRTGSQKRSKSLKLTKAKAGDWNLPRSHCLLLPQSLPHQKCAQAVWGTKCIPVNNALAAIPSFAHNAKVRGASFAPCAADAAKILINPGSFAIHATARVMHRADSAKREDPYLAPLQRQRRHTLPMCQANGTLTQEVTVTCGAETHFTMEHEGLPSGFRNGLGRIGIEHLGKGHADIKASEPPKKEGKEEAAPPAQIPVLLYNATLPMPK